MPQPFTMDLRDVVRHCSGSRLAPRGRSYGLQSGIIEMCNGTGASKTLSWASNRLSAHCRTKCFQRFLTLSKRAGELRNSQGIFSALGTPEGGEPD